ncbi:MAG: sugar phosphate isomerase/epimerase [Desulfobacteraceae bacterium]|nr:sugar phosphate isomerase/epimerase [Desulfobacteraceae bacterium]
MASIVISGSGEPDIAINYRLQSVLKHVYVNMPYRNLPQFLNLILEHGINIEIGLSAEDLENVPLDEIGGKVELIRQRGCRFTFHGPFWDLCPGSVDPGIRRISGARLRRLFEVAEDIRPDQIVCHTGFDPRHHRGHRATSIANSLTLWEPLAAEAERLNTRLLLENVWEEGPDWHKELFEKVNSPFFGFCLDTGHQHAFSSTPLRVWLEVLYPYLGEIHLHDNDGSFDHHLPVGMGSIDFDYLFGFLRERKIFPLLTVEPHTEEHLYSTLAGLAENGPFREFCEAGGEVDS